ncbi:MAG: tRNA pseudouridine(13) synthase TruD [Planctomycetes bacterium]|nr:tRNA pseudouridine(13) synthase TruD [Planctomycetota bacterium]
MDDSRELPYLTADVPPIHGVYKTRPEDFVVDELPAYEPCGEGTHVYARIEKRGITTAEAARRFARALGVGPRDIGYAGLKDAQGVTRQTFSVEHVDPERVQALGDESFSVLSVARHKNKLKLGHLYGNRFRLRLRGVERARFGDVESLLATLARRGVPNYFGEQRFGARGDGWEIGKALLGGDADRAVALIAGDPRPVDRGAVLKARELFARGEYEASARAWPGSFRDPIRLANAMSKKKGDARRSLFAVDRRMQQFFVSAWQSWLFNALLAKRLATFDQVLTGDLAWKYPGGAVFRVEDVAAEAPRAERFEISPTGPLYGPRMTEPSGEPATLEAAVLAEAGVERASFDQRGPLQPAGGRRPLRFRIAELATQPGRDDAGDFFELAFALDSGAYATSVLRELLKGEARRGGDEG